jgi:hypothetical protein
MPGNRKAALMSGTAKFSAGTGVAFGNGHGSRVSPPQRPLASAWQRARRSVVRPRRGIALNVSGPAQPSGARAKRVFALVLLLAITAVAVALYSTGRGLIPIGWLAVGPLLASLVLSPWITAGLAGWSLLREVPATVTTGRLASRYVSAAAEARVGGDLLEVVSDARRPRWLIGDTRGKGLPAVRLASVAMTSFRDACAQPDLSLPEIARVVDRSVTRAAGEEDFVTAVFAELDPHGWLQLVICGHPPPLRLTAGGGLQALTPRAYATPLGLHPDPQPSTFAVSPGDRLVFYTDGLLEARDRTGRYFRLEDCADTLRHPDLQAAADGLLARLLAHTGRKLDDDVALLLLEATSPVLYEPPRPHERDQPASPAELSAAGSGGRTGNRAA